jgi:hypothetical protein
MKSRSTSVDYTLQHSAGTTTVEKNQQANAGQWNSLGIFPFTQQGILTIEAKNDGKSYSADAVKFEKP